MLCPPMMCAICRGDVDYGSTDLPLLSHVQELAKKLGLASPFENLQPLQPTLERFGADYVPDAQDLEQAQLDIATRQQLADDPLDECLEDQVLSSATWDDVAAFLQQGQ